MSDIQKTYIYQSYSPSGDFLGVIPSVTSPFKVATEINKSFSTLEIEIGESADTSDQEVGTIQDEAGNDILDEAGYPIYEEQVIGLIDPDNPEALIAENNGIKVYEYSEDDVNGVLVFDGYIEDWRASLGSNDDKIYASCLSNGVDLDDFVIETGDTEIASHTTPEDAEIQGASWGFALAQRILPSSDISLNKIVLKMKMTSGSDTITPALYQGNPDNDELLVLGGEASLILGSGNTKIADFSSAEVNSSTYAEKTFTLSSPQTLTAGLNYYVLFWGYHDTRFFVRASNTLGTLPIQKAFYARATVNNTGYSLDYDTAKDSVYIKLLTSSGNVVSPFTNQDPSDILRDILDNYQGQGGIITYTEDSIDDTGTIESYTFNLQTTLEGVQKCLELAPANWYWWIDPATQILYFKQTASTPAHRFIKGRHVGEIEIGGTVENVRNVVYFSGGDTGAGENLFLKLTNAESIIAQGRRRLERLSDNRVAATSPATTLAQNFLDEHEDRELEAPLEILSSTYDIDSINPGDVVGFGGYGNLADRVVLQISRIDREADKVGLALGVLLKRQPEQVEALERALDKLQTIDNPDTPS